MEQRAMFFIDGYNIYKSLRKYYPTLKIQIDFRKLIQELLDDRMLIRAYYYVAPRYKEEHPTPKDKRIYETTQAVIEKIRLYPYFTVRLGSTTKYQKTFAEILKELKKTQPALGNIELPPQIADIQVPFYHEKGIDVNIATDMLSLAFHNAYDVAVLVSGDVDYVTVVKAIQDLGKIVENVSFVKSAAIELRKTCDKFVPLEKLIDKVKF